MANALMQSPDFNGFEKFGHPFGLILYYLFTFVVMVVLLNILIALYNSAYEDIYVCQPFCHCLAHLPIRFSSTCYA